MLNKPKRGVRVQVNSGPIMSNKITQTESSGSPPDSYKSNFSGSSGRSTIGHTTPVNIGLLGQYKRLLKYFKDEVDDTERVSINSLLSDDRDSVPQGSEPTTPSSYDNSENMQDTFIRVTSGYESGDSGKLICSFIDV